jgi:hypothetical protein
VLFQLTRRAFIAVISGCLVIAAKTQDDLQGRLKRDMTILAGSEMAGRGNGQEGLNKAIDYVINSYKKIGIETEIQRFPYHFSNSKNEEPDGYFSNVIVTVKGCDPELNSQHVVIGAHLDHLGSRPSYGGGITIYHGADDNASGTAALMELVRYYQKNPPARTLLFIHFTGEEWGLHGSKYWVSHPTVDIKSVRFMVNLDMIGRFDPIKAVLTFTAMGMSPEAIAKAKAMAPKGMSVETDRGTSIFANASDHAPFAANNIPACFFFTGIHSDYHRPTDTVDKINWNGLTAITLYVQRFITEYAGREDIPEFQYRPNLGMDSEPGRKVRVWRVHQGGSAEAAGLKQGDILTHINDKAVGSPKDLERVLDLFSRGDRVKLKWDRDRIRMETEAVLQ